MVNLWAVTGYTASMETSTKPPALDYDSLEQALQELAAVCGASECHGMVCGQLCRGTQTDARQWLELILGRPVGEDRMLAAQGARLLEPILIDTAGALGSADFSFEPLLPDDRESLSRRSAALGKWCEGYLFGFALGGELQENSLSGEAMEALRDLRDFTHIQVEEVMDEADEPAYMEVLEYIRVVVMLLFQELQRRPAAGTKTVE